MRLQLGPLPGTAGGVVQDEVDQDMTGLATELDQAIGRAVAGLREAGVLLGRDRGPARCHSAGSTATVGDVQ